MIQQWNDTAQELERLRRAVELHCACARPPQPPGRTCPAHSLLTHQATLHHLLFEYRARACFVRHEFQPD